MGVRFPPSAPVRYGVMASTTASKPVCEGSIPSTGAINKRKNSMPTIVEHPALYKKTSTGAIQTWRIRTEDNTIITTYGQVDGKMQEATDTITTGKNIGRSNETSPIQQAQAEAKAQWDQKVKKGYVENIDDAKDGKVNETVITGGVNPMLAHSYSKQGQKIKFPAYVQPKLDGHRCIAIVEPDGVTLWSRTRKPITGVPHIAKVIEALDLPVGMILDGELYNHDYKDKFEELTSFIRQETPKEGHEVVQYHVYDMVTDHPYFQRVNRIEAIEAKDPIVIVETCHAEDEDEMNSLFAEFVSKGYEGAIVRNADGKYVNKRSYDLQKVKEFDDAEFEIVRLEEGRGKMAGKAIFICTTDGSNDFKVKLVGKLDDLRGYLKNPKKWIGKKLTVQFQGYTNTGIPRFPIGLRFREDV
jgi:DNA ligase-1